MSGSRPCAVAACDDCNVDAAHAVDTRPPGALPLRAALCPRHWRQVVEGAEWFAEEQPGDPDRRGIRIVMGAELAGRDLAVVEEPGIVWRRGGFSAGLDPERNFGVLGIEGRVYGSDERRRLDLALTPAAVRQLRSVLRLYTDAGDTR
jgi:hypothetical protein